MEKTDKTTPHLEWLRNLPEAGAVAGFATKEAELLQRRRDMLAQIEALDLRIEELRGTTAGLAVSHWTPDEIAAAKASAE